MQGPKKSWRQHKLPSMKAGGEEGGELLASLASELREGGRCPITSPPSFHNGNKDWLATPAGSLPKASLPSPAAHTGQRVYSVNSTTLFAIADSPLIYNPRRR